MNTKSTKLSAILLFAAGGLSTVSAQTNTTPVVYQKLGENPFTLESSAALQIDSNNRGFLLPRVTDPTTITKPVQGLMILNTGLTGVANQLQINIGGDNSSPEKAAKWVGFSSSSPTITTHSAAYTLVADDSTVLFDLSGVDTPNNVDVTLPPVNAINTGKIYVINRLDNSGGKTLTFKIDGLTDSTKNGLVLSPKADVLKTLNYAKKITIQANYTAASGLGVTPAVLEVASWNIINMN